MNYVEFYVEKNPALKEQATAWVKDMLVFYDGRLETADCCDGYVVAAAIDLACSLGAKDLIPIINNCFVLILLISVIVDLRQRWLKGFIGVNCSGRSMLLMYMNGITG